MVNEFPVVYCMEDFQHDHFFSLAQKILQQTPENVTGRKPVNYEASFGEAKEIRIRRCQVNRKC